MKHIYFLLAIISFNLHVFAQTPNVYGVTSKGGKYDAGVIFQMDANGNNYQKLKDLEAIPFNISRNICKASNGIYYGIGQQGGNYYVYKYNPITLETIVVKDLLSGIGYNSSNNKFFGFTEASNGLLYATLYDHNGYGGIFEFNPSNNNMVLKFSFNGTTDGAYPYCALYLATNNKLYGTTEYGGSNDLGVVFEYDYTNNVFTKKYDAPPAPSGWHPGFEFTELNGKLHAMYGNIYSNSNNYGITGFYDYDLSTGVSTVQDFNVMGSTFTSFYTHSTKLELASNGYLYTFGGIGSSTDVYEYQPSIFRCYQVYNNLTAGLFLTNKFIKGTNNKLYCAGYTMCGSQPTDSTCKNFNIYEFDLATYLLNTKTTITGIDNTLYSYLENYNTGFVTSSGSNIVAVINNAVIEYNTNTDVSTKKSQLGRVYGSFPNGKPILKNNHLYNSIQTMSTNKQDFGPMIKFNLANQQLTQPIPSSNDVGGNYIDLSNNEFMAVFGLGKTSINAYNFNSATGTYTSISNGYSGVMPSGYYTKGVDGFIYGSGEYAMNGSSGTAIYAIDVANNDEYLISLFTNVLQGTDNRGIVQCNNGKIYGVSNGGGVFSKGVLYSLDLYNYNVTKLIDFNGTARGAYPDGQLVQASNGKFMVPQLEEVLMEKAFYFLLTSTLIKYKR